MITIGKIAESGGSAGKYYSQQSDKEQYYQQGGQTVGTWHTIGNEEFVKNNEIVNTNELDMILGGKDKTGKNIVFNADDPNRRKGYDVCFSPDKSVSIAYSMAKENKDIDMANKIKSIHDKAVESTMQEISKHALYRETQNKKTYDVYANNIMYASYFHEVNRELEPNIHTHCLLANMVKTQDGSYKALENKEIMEYQKTFQRVYTAELAKEFIANNISIEKSKNGFRIAGISQDLCDKYSVRSSQIKDRVKELKKLYPGVSDIKLREMACLDTRKKKDTSKELTATLDPEDLAKYEDFKKINQDKTYNESITNRYMTVPEAINAVSKDLTSKEAVFSENMLLSRVLDYSMGKSLNIDEIQKEIAKNKELVKLNDKEYTTKEMIHLEKKIKKEFLSGIHNHQAIADKKTVDSGISIFEKNNNFNLSNEQKNAINTMLTSQDRHIIIQGVAGAGKTTLLNCVNQIAKDQQYQLIAVSFQGKAADEMSKVLGKDVASGTIESFKNMQNISSKHIIIMDEASMTSLKDMDAVLSKVKSSGCKLVMLGDIKQIQSIGSGNSFEQAQRLGLSTAELWESRRQKDKNYAKVIDLFARGKTQKSFEMIEKMGKIKEFNDEDKIKAVIEKYYNFKRDGSSTIIVCNKNAEKDIYNDIIHENNKEKGLITNSKIYDISKNKNLSEVELRQCENYSTGDKLFLKDNSIIGKSGDEFTVKSIDYNKNSVELTNKDNQIHILDLKDQDLVEKIGGITTQTTAELGIGDRIMLTKNDRMFDVKNGQMAVITGIKGDIMEIKIGEEGKEDTIRNIDLKQYNNIDLAYAISINKSQGMTSDKVISSINSSVINKNNFYVANSRGKQDFFIATDSIENTKKNIEIAQKKTSALSFLREKYQSIDKIYLLKEKAVDKTKDIFKTIQSKVKGISLEI